MATRMLILILSLSRLQICSIFAFVCTYHVSYDFITRAGSHVNHYSQDYRAVPILTIIPHCPFIELPALFPIYSTFSNPLCGGVPVASCIQCFVAPWVVARQASLSIDFSARILEWVDIFLIQRTTTNVLVVPFYNFQYFKILYK